MTELLLALAAVCAVQTGSPSDADVQRECVAEILLCLAKPVDLKDRREALALCVRGER